DELPELPAPVSGVSLQELKVLGNEYGVPIKVAYRELGAELITNSITLFKLGHYAYIGDRTRDQILPSTVDPFLNYPTHFTQETLERQSTGYFLIPADTELPEGWRLVSDDEAAAQVGARLQFPLRETPEVAVDMITDGSSLYVGAAIEISGAPG